MAGITNLPFRKILRAFECGLISTEMVSARALYEDNPRTKELIEIEKDEHPIAVQIFGNKPEVMADAAQKGEDAGADIIDINMGCPMPKIVKNGAGAALMLDPDLVSEIIKKVDANTKLPVTVKIRAGWDSNNINAVEIAQTAQKANAKMVTVHGRTKSQVYKGHADWGIIQKVKNSVDIPVIGNGDIFEPEDASLMLSKTGCDGVMLARGILGNPWLIGRTVKFLKNGTCPPKPSPEEKIEMALYHLNLAVKYRGEKRGVLEMRKHTAWYIKGLPSARKFRTRLNSVNTKEEMTSLLKEFKNKFSH